MAPERLPVGFSGVDPPDADRLDASVESLHGVGPTLARRLGRIGLATVGDVLLQRPRRYEEPVRTRSRSP